MSAPDPNYRPTSSASTRSRKLSSVKKIFNSFSKKKGEKDNEETKIPETKHWRTSARDISDEERTTAPNLGDGGWGEESWQRVRPNRQQQFDTSDDLPQAPYQSGNGISASIQRMSAQDRSTSTRALFNFGDRLSLSPSSSHATTPPLPEQLQVTPTRRIGSGNGPHTPQNTPPPTRTHTTPSHRTPSVSSGASSLRSQSQKVSTHTTPSGSSYTSQGVNVRALPKRRTTSSGGASYTKQGVRVGTDGYVAKWKDPKKEEGVWKEHPALQPRPG
jgi:hypothetical protein